MVRNQCDGCRLGYRIEDGIHYDSQNHGYMVCTSNEYDEGLRYDEMQTAEDYNRYEEEQVFQDREWDD